jgi:MFS family permease
MQAIVVHIAPHAIDSGIIAIVAASLVSIIAVISLIGRVSLGYLSDRAGAIPALAACLVIFALALIWLLFAKGSWMFYVFAVVFGLAYGGEAAVMTLVPAELFGLKYLGGITAATFFMGAIGGAIGSPLAGRIFDVTGSYDLAFIICIIMSALAFTLSLILLRSGSKGYLVVAE